MDILNALKLVTRKIKAWVTDKFDSYPVRTGSGENSLIIGWLEEQEVDGITLKGEAAGRFATSIGVANKANGYLSHVTGQQNEAHGQVSDSHGLSNYTYGACSVSNGYSTVAGNKMFLIESYTDNGDGTCTIVWVAPNTNVQMTHTNKGAAIASPSFVLNNTREVSGEIAKLDSITLKNKVYISCRGNYNRHHFGMIQSWDTATRTVVIKGVVTNADDYDKTVEILTLSDSLFGDNKPSMPANCGATFWVVGYPLAGTTDADLLEEGEDAVSMATFGIKTKAQNLGAAAFGKKTCADGRYSFAAGKETKAGYCAFATGQGTSASGNNSFTFGHNSRAYGANSLAGGQECDVRGHCSIAVGYDVNTTNKGEAAFGHRNKTGAEGLLFSIGNGEDTQSNAVEIYENGDMWVSSELTIGETKVLDLLKKYDERIAALEEQVEAMATSISEGLDA